MEFHGACMEFYGSPWAYLAQVGKASTMFETYQTGISKTIDQTVKPGPNQNESL